MRKLLGGIMLCLSFGCTPAHAQWSEIFNSVAPIAGVGPRSALTLTGTGLFLSQPLSTVETLSNEYSVTLPVCINNTIPVGRSDAAMQASAGCFGTCFF
jgi:hypothetical protein